ncbi:hypothetical protein [[Ruminococcus] lactaris]|uniref:hypothetical protein n=1 Tax=[Ruminococcus] lactaris TaxID=46228 RepID=UPI00242F1BDE|nr:hypothetical protein [[Ruminococcus] lactaris]
MDKDNNGYRNYTAQDVETLKRFQYIENSVLVLKTYRAFLETGDKSDSSSYLSRKSAGKSFKRLRT